MWWVSAPQQPGALGDHHLAAVAGQQPDGGGVDRGSSTRCAQPVSSATRLRRAPCGRKHLRRVERARRRQRRAARASSIARSCRGISPANGRPSRAARSASAEPPRIGQDLRQRPAQRPLERRAAVGLARYMRGRGRPGACSARPTGRWSCRRGSDRQRSMCLTVFSSAGRPGLQHVLDQVDAPARAVELVAQHLVGRAGRGAEAAMHAGPQDPVRPRGRRVARAARG